MLVATHLIYYFHSNLFGLENVLGAYLELFGLGTFFLSGFVLGYNNRKFNGWSDVASFFKKRLLRIYPLYLVALAIAVGAFVLLPSQSHQSLSSAGVLIYALDYKASWPLATCQTSTCFGSWASYCSAT